MVLNDLKRVRSIDKDNMLDTLRRTPDMFEEALNLAMPSNLDIVKPKLVAFLGMGGSSVGPGILADWTAETADVPMLLIRDSKLPKYVSDAALAVAVSYSGNTHETVGALLEAERRGCPTVAVSSGGLLEKACVKRGIAHIKIPSGYLPRCAFPFLFAAPLRALETGGLVKHGSAELKKAIGALRNLNHRIGIDKVADENDAKRLATQINGTVPLVYGYREFTHAAYRIKTQLNENSKVPAMYAVVPEVCHNEVVAWHDGAPEHAKKFGVLLIRSPSEDEETAVRLNFIKRILNGQGARVHEVQAEGAARVERILTTVYFGDYVSFYLAILRGVDPSATPGIAVLKREIDSKTSYRKKVEAELGS
ncbi:MAG: bifunctional phosphoglucose/phosphomannose isomerase [Candidatus Bathyarchaeia archaeon]